MRSSKAKASVLQLLAPDDDPEYIRVRQATKQGYIRLHRGGERTYLIRHQNSAEGECRITVNAALR